MRKPVELSPSAYRWILRHPFISEDVIIGIVQDAPSNVREYISEDYFKISFNRKKNRKLVKVIVWVQETSSRYFAYKMHSCKI